MIIELNTSNMASQDPTYRIAVHKRGPAEEPAWLFGSHVYGQNSYQGHEWSAIEPLGIRGSEVASESKKKIFKWTVTRNRGRGRYKSQGGIQQQDVVRSRSSILCSTPLSPMGTVQTQQIFF